MSAELTTDTTDSQSSMEISKRNVAIGDRGLVITNFEELSKMSGLIARSGLAPRDLATPEKVLVVFLQAMELGLPLMTALQSSCIINGRHSFYGELVVAQVHAHPQFQDQKTEWFGEQGKDSYGCRVTLIRKGKEPATGEFTIAEARTGDLLGKDTWKKAAKTMLYFRAFHLARKQIFPDVMKGGVTREEAEDDEIPGLENARDVTPKHEVRSAPADIRIHKLKDPETVKMAPAPLVEAQGKNEIAKTQPVQTASPQAKGNPTGMDLIVQRLEDEKIPHEKFMRFLVNSRIIEPAQETKGIEGLTARAITLVLNNWQQVSDSLGNAATAEVDRP
jgi:hypothetical protein